MVAGDYVAREVKCLAEDGRIVIIAVQGGVAGDRSTPAWCCAGACTITGSTLRPRPVAFKAAIAAALREQGLAAARGRRRQAGDPPGVPGRRGRARRTR